jgi:predicted dithiol-disulfide oxidoreductase (DUF899 family)
MQLPQVVSQEEWQAANDALVAKEKEATRARDALAAERRRQPMTEISTEYEFDGPDGRVNLLDLFEGRTQMIMYHFWFPVDGDPCRGCSMVGDHIPPHEHLNARDTTIAVVARAPQDQIQAFKQKMGWRFPFYSVVGEEFQKLRGTDEYFAIDAYLRDGDKVYLTYSSRARGAETIVNTFSLLDLTALGRQEEWEDTPEGRPQEPPYQWWRYKYDYA